MAHTRKDTLTVTVQWAKHLRPFWKKLQNKKERQRSLKQINNIKIEENL